jgi:hexosaminidase
MPLRCLANHLVSSAVLFVVQGVALAQGSTLSPQIPSLASFIPSNTAPFTLSHSTKLIVDSRFASYGEPSLYQLASTFHSNLVDLVGFSSLPPVTVASPDSTAGHASSIFLTLNTTANFTLYNGDPTNEGYQFIVSENTYLIAGAAPIGTWWGTRSLLQQVALLQSKNGASSQKGAQILIPSGSGYDSPGWEVRGFMLDAGRHFFESNFLGKNVNLAHLSRDEIVLGHDECH